MTGRARRRWRLGDPRWRRPGGVAVTLPRMVPSTYGDHGTFVSVAERIVLAGDRLYVDVSDNKDPFFYAVVAVGRTVSHLATSRLKHFGCLWRRGPPLSWRDLRVRNGVWHWPPALARYPSSSPVPPTSLA